MQVTPSTALLEAIAAATRVPESAPAKAAEKPAEDGSSPEATTRRAAPPGHLGRFVDISV